MGGVGVVACLVVRPLRLEESEERQELLRRKGRGKDVEEDLSDQTSEELSDQTSHSHVSPAPLQPTSSGANTRQDVEEELSDEQSDELP